MAKNIEVFKKIKVFLGIIDCAYQTYKSSGKKGFFKGFLANFNRSIIWNATELGAYDYFKSILVKLAMNPDKFNTHLLAGALAGITGTLVISPIEITKNRYSKKALKYYRFVN
jgi:hypothetical protein